MNTNANRAAALPGRRTLVSVFIVVFLIALSAAMSLPVHAASLDQEADYDIPMQPIASALVLFSRQAGVQVVTATKDLAGIQGSQVKGKLSLRDAATRLLEKTRLSFKLTGEGTLVVTSDEGKSISLPAAPVAGAASPGASPVPGKEAEDFQTIQTVIVTAQHRKERLQEVPVSVQVIDGMRQMEQNLNSLDKLTQTAPSVKIAPILRTNEMYIRGIGSGTNLAFDQSVGMFIDGIYHGRSRLSFSTFMDLDRVEILKGPQSTYFGNNAIAGAFSVTTRKPSFETDGSVRAFYGNFGQYAVEAAGGGALSDTLAARVAVIAAGMKGYVHNVVSGNDAPKTDNLAGRVTLLFKPNTDLDATLKIEGSNNRNAGGIPHHYVNCPPAAPFNAATWCLTAIAKGLNALGDYQDASGPGQVSSLDTKESILTVNFRQAGYLFTSVTGYQDYNSSITADIDGLPDKFFIGQGPEGYHQLSQEFRVASPANQTIEYLAGIYYHKGKLWVQSSSNFFYLSPTILAKPTNAALFPFLPLGYTYDNTHDETSTSIFGALSWNATDRLKLTGSLRGSRVTKDMVNNWYFGTAQDFGSVVPLPASVVPVANTVGVGTQHLLSASRADQAWQPSAKIQYKISPASMVYASFSRGFKAGGFNGSDNSGVADRLPFGPEHVDAYEVGVKNQWDKALLNVTLFRSNYSDLQVASLVPTGLGTFLNLINNAAKSLSQGVEFEGQWAVSPSFRLAATATYLDAHYVSYPGAAVTQLQQLGRQRFQDLSGRPTEYAPKWSGSLTGTYRMPLSNDYRLTAELGAFYSASYYVSATDDPLFEQQSYTRVDGRLSLETPGRRWGFDLIGRNLSDRKLIATSSAIGNGVLGSVTTFYQMPRSLGLQARYSW